MGARAVARTAKEAISPEISVAHAKAHFSEVVTGVEQHRQPITIMRRGKAVAQIVPISISIPTLYGSMRGTMVEVGDIVGPTGGEWTIGGE